MMLPVSSRRTGIVSNASRLTTCDLVARVGLSSGAAALGLDGERLDISRVHREVAERVADEVHTWRALRQEVSSRVELRLDECERLGRNGLEHTSTVPVHVL